MHPSKLPCFAPFFPHVPVAEEAEPLRPQVAGQPDAHHQAHGHAQDIVAELPGGVVDHVLQVGAALHLPAQGARQESDPGLIHGLLLYTGARGYASAVLRPIKPPTIGPIRPIGPIGPIRRIRRINPNPPLVPTRGEGYTGRQHTQITTLQEKPP